MPPPPSGFERELQVLEAELRRLEGEYNMFFAGRLPRLPWETRARTDAMVKRIDRSAILNTGERFRFQTLQSRYTAFCELWERTQRAREEGRAGPGRPRPAPPPPKPMAPIAAETSLRYEPGTTAAVVGPPAAPEAPAAQPAESNQPAADRPAIERPAPERPVPELPSAAARWRDGEAHITRVARPDGEADKVRELYEQLREARRATGEPEVSYDRVAQVVKHQVARLGAGGADVAFRVTVRDGKVAFTAKPVKGDDAGEGGGGGE